MAARGLALPAASTAGDSSAIARPDAGTVPAAAVVAISSPTPERRGAPETLRRRAEFLACAKGRRWTGRALLLQALERPTVDKPGADGAGPIRAGYTCSKKIGNAVTRNRAKRRLRAAAAAVLPERGRPGWDYVLVGRPGATVAVPFATLIEDLEAGLARVHAPPRRGG